MIRDMGSVGVGFRVRGFWEVWKDRWSMVGLGRRGWGQRGDGASGEMGHLRYGLSFHIISSPACRTDGEMLPLKACFGPAETSQRCPQLDASGIRGL